MVLMAALPAQARLNLPQSRLTVTVPSETVRALRENLRSSTDPTAELPEAIHRDLLSALPQDFRGACSALMEHWGEIAKGTDEWRARILLRRGERVWLALRCASRAPHYGQFYDERLALLRLDTGKLELFATGPDAENDSTLYHLESAEALPLEGAQGFAFKLVLPGENPCCDGPESSSEERLMVLSETPRGITESLSVVTARDESSHSDDPEIDSETTYRAEVKFECDSTGHVAAVTAPFHEESKEFSGDKPEPQNVNRRSGTLRYYWNPASLTFDQIK